MSDTNGEAVELASEAESRETHFSPRESRAEAVAELLKVAMSRAGTLQLTAEESRALLKEFPDDAFRGGAGGKAELIYIEHAHLRDRLNQTLGLGQWANVVREQWTENFKIKKDGKELPGIRVYVRAMLLIRGCYVGEAVGDMDYYQHNNAQNFGDAFEGATTAAFRRCCKQFGVGVQAWSKAWCEGWWARKRAPRQESPPQQAPKEKPAVSPEREAAEKEVAAEKSGAKSRGLTADGWNALLADYKAQGTSTMTIPQLFDLAKQLKAFTPPKQEPKPEPQADPAPAAEPFDGTEYEGSGPNDNIPW